MDDLKSLINTGKTGVTYREREEIATAAASRAVVACDNDELTVDEIGRRVGDLIADWANTYGIEKLSKISGTMWSACCSYIGTVFLRPSHWLKSNIMQSKAAGVPDTANNAYDPARVAAVWDVFEFYCNLYDKITYISDFARFCGVSMDYLREFGAWLTSTRFHLRERLNVLEEDSLRRYAGRDSIGRLADLNHNFGWNSPKAQTVEGSGGGSLDMIPTTGNFKALTDKR